MVYSYSETLVKMKPAEILNNFECFEFDQENGSTIEVIRSKYLSHQLIWKTPTKKIQLNIEQREEIDYYLNTLQAALGKQLHYQPLE